MVFWEKHLEAFLDEPELEQERSPAKQALIMMT